jgi:ribonuclease P protein component
MASACGCARGPGAPSSPGAGAGAATGSPPELGVRLPVLARSLRLRTAEDFRQTTRQGRRCSTYTVVVHALFDDSPPPPRVGIAVNKAVGIAVQRNRVKRRLRAVMATHVTSLPGGRVVIRALPPSARAGFASLAGDVDRCVNRLKAAAA